MSTLATTIGRGVTGSRPSASEAGRLYYDTTTNIFYRDNGSSWDSVSPSALTNPMDGGGQLIYGGTGGTPTKLANGSSGQVLTSAGSTSAPTWATPSSAPTASEAFQSGAVTMVSANTWYDGPSLSLAAGTYVLFGKAQFYCDIASYVAVKIWDGTTLMSDTPEHYLSTNAKQISVAVHGYVVLGSPTTVKISAATNVGSSQGVLNPSTPGNGTTNKMTHLVALKIA